MGKWRQILFEKPPEHHTIHVGLRMLKTVLAVFICAAIGYLRGQPTFFSMIAAVLCMQNTAEKTLITSFNRLVGSVIGGAYGVLILIIAAATGIQEHMLVYYALISVMLIPIITTTLLINKPTASAFTCVVFLSITVYHITDTSPLTYAFNRVLDTVVGIAVALIINLAIPIKNKTE